MVDNGKIVIIHNDIAFANKLKKEMLKHFDEDIIVCNHFNQQYIYSTKIDLLLLDIDLDVSIKGHKVNEIEEIIKIWEQKRWDVEIIFITSQNDFINSSFDPIPLYFIDKENWHECLSRALQALKRKQFREYYIYITENHKINIHDTIFIELLKNQEIYFHMRDNTMIKVKKTLEDIEKDLNKMHCYRIHKSYIVNMIFIKKKYFDKVILWDNRELPISRGYRKEFKELYKIAKMEGVI